MLVKAAIVYLFVQMTGPVTAYPIPKTLYVTTDKTACEEQALAWNTKIAPLRPMYFCLEHASGKFESESADD